MYIAVVLMYAYMIAHLSICIAMYVYIRMCKYDI